MAQERTSPWTSALPAGPTLTLWATVVTATLCSFTYTVANGGVDGWRALVRLSAQASLLFFVAAFAASSLRVFRRTPLTAWLLVNRRYVGLSFAASHTIHLLGIVALALTWPEFERGPETLIFGGLGYVFLYAMVATSFDGAVAWLGRRRWYQLHRTGMYYLWGIFMLSYVPRTFTASLWYAPFTVLLVGALGLRIAAARRHARPLPAPRAADRAA